MVRERYSIIYTIYIIITTALLLPQTVLSQADSTADSTVQFKLSLNAYPYAYYTPETQLAFGAGRVYTFYFQKDSCTKEPVTQRMTGSDFY